MNSHKPWVDVLKGLAIMMVLIAHRDTIPLLRHYINSFHMGLFIAISGFLNNPERHPRFSGYVRNRAYRLLIAYVAFSILALPLYAYNTLKAGAPLDFAWWISVGEMLVDEYAEEYHVDQWEILEITHALAENINKMNEELNETPEAGRAAKIAELQKRLGTEVKVVQLNKEAKP